MWILDCHTLHGLSLTLEALVMLILTDIVMSIQWEFLLEVLFKARFNVLKKNLDVQVPIRPHHLMCGTL